VTLVAKKPVSTKQLDALLWVHNVSGFEKFPMVSCHWTLIDVSAPAFTDVGKGRVR
jgi:hypothetical protein